MDKEETKKFIFEIVGNFSGSDFSDEGFEEVFNDFDKDGSGTIDKHEMFIFMK